MRSELTQTQDMDKKFPGIRKNIIILVSLVATVFLTGGVWLGVWSARSMRESVVEQFNEEQLVIAHSVASLIERDLSLLKKEISLLQKDHEVEKVLLVDDEENVRALVSATLAVGERLQVIHAKDGEEAVRIAQEEKPNLIVLSSMLLQTSWTIAITCQTTDTIILHSRQL